MRDSTLGLRQRHSIGIQHKESLLATKFYKI
jgi:hypothetical protein